MPVVLDGASVEFAQRFVRDVEVFKGHENRVSHVVQTLHTEVGGVRLEKPQRRNASVSYEKRETRMACLG